MKIKWDSLNPNDGIHSTLVAILRWRYLAAKAFPYMKDSYWPYLQAAMDIYNTHMSAIMVREGISICFGGIVTAISPA